MTLTQTAHESQGFPDLQASRQTEDMVEEQPNAVESETRKGHGFLVNLTARWKVCSQRNG